MSRDILGGNLRGKGESERDVYEEPDARSDDVLPEHVLIDELSHWLSTIESQEEEYNSLAFFEQCTEELSCVLTPHFEEQLDSQSFLDTLITRLMTSQKKPSVISSLFSPLIQVIYEQGHNHFCLEFSCLNRPYWDVLDYLHGSEDRPLELAFNNTLRVVRFGTYASHCQLNLSGDICIVGGHASYSEFTYTNRSPLGDVSTVVSGDYNDLKTETLPCMIGSHSDHCAFKLPNYVSASIIPDHPSPSDIYIQLTRPDGTLDLCRVTWNFFKNENKLYVSDGEDGWIEMAR